MNINILIFFRSYNNNPNYKQLRIEFVDSIDAYNLHDYELLVNLPTATKNRRKMSKMAEKVAKLRRLAISGSTISCENL